MKTFSDFKAQVIFIVRSIPSGTVVSYGQVALYIGVPRAARQVGWVLNGTEGKIDLPWWRVINREGRISIKGTKFNDRELQKHLLVAEGVIVSNDFIVDMKKYRFIADPQLLASFHLDNEYMQQLITRGFL